MKYKLNSFLLIGLAVFFPGFLPAQTFPRNDNYARIGVAQVNITPDQPVIMSGYDSRKTPSTGVHDSLFASALFFTRQEEKALVITADLIGFPTLLVDTLKGMIAEKTGIPTANILIVAEHNHGGPAIHVYEAKLPQANDDYVNVLKNKLVALSIDAMKNPVTFRMGIGKTSCNLNINRRAVFADGGVWLGRNPDGPSDHDLVVVKFVDDQNNLLAALVNWPCHGTASGQENYNITGDWAASAARWIKKLAGKNLVVAMTAGASANINPIYGPGSDFDEVEAIGFHVGNQAWKELIQTETFPVKSLDCMNSSLSFPGKKSWKDQYPQTSYPTGTDVQVRISALRLDGLVLCGISGELMTEMGMEIKKESPYTSTVVITHCNGSSGYICTDKSFTEGGYETKVSHLMPGIEKPLVQKCVDLIHSF
jgi:hypothetical protein